VKKRPFRKWLILFVMTERLLELAIIGLSIWLVSKGHMVVSFYLAIALIFIRRRRTDDHLKMIISDLFPNGSHYNSIHQRNSLVCPLLTRIKLAGKKMLQKRTKE